MDRIVEPRTRRGYPFRNRLAGLITASALVTAVAFTLAPTAGAASVPSFVGKGTVAHAPQGIGGEIIHDQNDNDAGIAVSSQNYEAYFDAYDASGADDFTLTATRTKVTHVVVTGVYYYGYGPAVSETVTFYKDAGGLPGARIARRTRTGTDSEGSFVIQLGSRGPRLHAGTYWLGFVVNMDFSVGGNWGWEARSVQSGNPAAWRNPGNAWNTACTKWGVLTTCWPGAGPDLMFKLTGY